MHKSKKDIIVVLVIILSFYLMSFPLNGWLSATMPRHQIIQLPVMLVLGLILGTNFSRLIIKDLYWGIAVLIFIMASLTFWMLPRSIDLSVLDHSFNRAMHFNMLFAGVLLMAVLRGIILEIKILFLGMLSAMLLVTGFTLRTFDILLCSSFDIEQQKQTGLYWIIIGSLMFLLTFFIFFKAVGQPKQDKSEVNS